MENIRFGFAENPITPLPHEVMMDGYGHRTMPCEGVRTDVFVKTAVLSTKKETLYFIALDICGFDEALMNLINEHIYYHCKVDTSKIVYTATHTHTGPIGGLLLEQGRSIIYWNKTAEIIARTLKKSIDNLEEGSLEIKVCDKELNYIYNRMGREDIDRRVFLAVFKNLKGELKGVITSASCHCTCLGDMLISGDYPAKMYELMKKEYPNLPVLFLAGRGGDTNPVRPQIPDSVELFEKLGKDFYEVISDGLKNLSGEKEENFDLREIRETIEVPCQENLLSVEEYEKRIEKEYAFMYSEDTPLKKRWVVPEINYLKACRDVVKYNLSRSVKAELQVFKINKESIFVFLPFELLCRTGNLVEEEMIKLGYKKGKIFVIGYANANKSYLPPKKYCHENRYDIKGRDAATHWGGRLEYSDKSEDAVIEGIISLVKKLK